ncbi:MAG: amidohydrolase [Microbacterium sp.]|uniref:amidohydrolase n=1 Tax=Microbacterium sp. TaxID=51671 RepID=UPI003F803446
MTVHAYDRVILADTILTLDPAHPVAQAIALDHGHIVAVGDRDDAKLWAAKAVVELGDATITPGFADSHSHPVIGMRTVRGIDLSEVRDLEGLARALRTNAPSGSGWVLGWNLSPEAYAQPGIDVDFFARILPGRPVFLKTFDYHAAFVSREALDRAGVQGPVEFTSHARIECDDEGRPTGAVWEMDAVALIEGAIAQPPLAVQAEELHTLLRDMAATGLTLTHSLILDETEIDLLEKAERIAPLPLRYLAAPVCEPGSTREDWERLAQLQSRRGLRWRIQGVKFFLDGTVDNGTAWLQTPDAHGESTTSIWHDTDEYAAAIGFFAQRGIPTFTHAIGDAAIRFALLTLGAVPRPQHGTHRIEHIEVLPTDLVPLFAEFGVAASMQPAHACLSVQADHSDNWSQRLGDRAARGFAQKDIIEAGGLLVLGSDWPIGPYDAREIMAIAQLRRPVARTDRAPVIPAQRLSLIEALEAYTRSPAVAAGQTQEGVITVGNRATLTAFGADIRRVAPDDLPAVPVIFTVIDGVDAYTSLPAAM